MTFEEGTLISRRDDHYFKGYAYIKFMHILNWYRFGLDLI